MTKTLAVSLIRLLMFNSVGLLLLPAEAVSMSQSDDDGKQEVFARREEVEALKSKVDQILDFLVKNGSFAETSQGPEGETGARKESGTQGPPGPAAGLTEILARLEELEKFRKIAESKIPLIGTIVALEPAESQVARQGDNVNVNVRTTDDPPINISRGSVDHPTLPPSPTIANNGSRLQNLTESEVRNKIVIGTSEGVKFYSEDTNDLQSIINSKEVVEGVAWDDKNHQLYYSCGRVIYRVGADGSESQTVFTSTTYDMTIGGLAVDWITNNLYGITMSGNVFVCNTAATSGTLSCSTLLSSQGLLLTAITLDPNRGTMYFTNGTNEVGSIVKSYMDASNVTQIIRDLSYPAGITVDFKSSRLFWVECFSGMIRSSDLDGQDIQLVAQIGQNDCPWAIVIITDELFWGTYNSEVLQTSSLAGQNIRTLINGTYKFQQLAVASSYPEQTRRNHCDGQACQGICVLTQDSFRCLPPSFH